MKQKIKFLINTSNEPKDDHQRNSKGMWKISDLIHKPLSRNAKLKGTQSNTKS